MIYRGGISDIFSFTLLQEMMARQLRLCLGPYHHQVGSSHVYESDYYAVEKILTYRRSRDQFDFSFPVMPDGDNWPSILTVLDYEEWLRRNKIALSIDAISEIDVPEYWRQVINLLEIQREIQHQGRINPENFAYLYPVYKHLVAHRFARYLNRSVS